MPRLRISCLNLFRDSRNSLSLAHLDSSIFLNAPAVFPIMFMLRFSDRLFEGAKSGTDLNFEGADTGLESLPVLIIERDVLFTGVLTFVLAECEAL